MRLAPRENVEAFELTVHSSPPTSAREVVALVHGFGDNLVTWKALTTAIESSSEARDAACVRLDLPGFGRSPLPANFAREYVLECARLVRAWLRQVAPNSSVTIVGNSLGGSVALASTCLQGRDTDAPRITSAVLFDPATPWTRTPPFVKLLDLPTYGWLDALSHRGRNRPWQLWNRLVARVVVRTMTAPGFRPDPEWLTSIGESLARPGAWADLEQVARAVRSILVGEARETLDLLGHLDAIDVPVQIVRGALDPVIGAGELRRLAAEIPGARRVELRGVGHCPQMEAAPESARWILDALSRKG